MRETSEVTVLWDVEPVARDLEVSADPGNLTGADIRREAGRMVGPGSQWLHRWRQRRIEIQRANLFPLTGCKVDRGGKGGDLRIHVHVMRGEVETDQELEQ